MTDLIQWPRAKYWMKAWNPYIGCHPESPACDHCYAAAWAQRFGHSFQPHLTARFMPPTKGVVFVGNMTDLFGEWVDPFVSLAFLGKMFSYSSGDGPTPFPATYLWLTKRVARMADALSDFTLSGADAFFGFTSENQEFYDNRLRVFRGSFPSRFKGWLSVEPLLGPIDLGLRYISPEDQPFKWVVVGCESGPHRRPCKLDWVEDVVAECRSAGVPVFVKQLDICGECVRDIERFPAHLRIRQVPWSVKGGAA